MTRIRIFFGFLLLAEFLFSPVAQAKVKTVALAHIEDGTVRLRVAHAINPRMPKASQQEIQAMLKAMQETVLDHFQIKVLLEKPVEVDVSLCSQEFRHVFFGQASRISLTSNRALAIEEN